MGILPFPCLHCYHLVFLPLERKTRGILTVSLISSQILYLYWSQNFVFFHILAETHWARDPALIKINRNQSVESDVGQTKPTYHWQPDSTSAVLCENRGTRKRQSFCITKANTFQVVQSCHKTKKTIKTRITSPIKCFPHSIATHQSGKYSLV